jgi:uncharacterized phage protein gp47/JayE
MALTARQISDQIVTQLHFLDPAISAEVGTPERKIIDAVAEQISSAQIDLEVLNQQHDVDTMVGGRLDAFLALFGFGRQRSIQSTGVATFSRPTAATTDIIIPSGTQLLARQSDSSFPDLTFITTATAVMKTGDTTVDAPIRSAVVGTIGNVPANAIVAITNVQSINGVTNVTNNQPTTGGLDGESDSDFKIRFKNTVFRNIAGTQDQFLALAVSSPYVTKANVVGPMSRYQEYIQVPAVVDSTGVTSWDPGDIYDKYTSVPSGNPYSKYTYSYNYFVTNGQFGVDTLFLRPNVDFVFNNPARTTAGAIDAAAQTDNKPNVTFINVGGGGSVETGDVLLLEHAYMSANSRNKIATGGGTHDILNAVDVFVDGSFPYSVSSLERMPSTINNFVNSAGAFGHIGNYERVIDGSAPTVGNRFLPLFWQPLLDVPDTITIGNNLYYKANYRRSVDGEYFADADYVQKAHYFTVVDTTEHYGTIRARNGIEWRTNFVDTSPAIGLLVTPSDTGPVIATDASLANTNFLVDNYTYDKNIEDLQAITDKQKQVTTDVLVHKARNRFFKLYITVMYSPGSTIDNVNAAIQTALDVFFKSQYFGTVIQMSDLLQTIHNVPGVDNVRWTRDSNGAINKVEEVRPNGDSFVSPIYFNEDFYLQDNELALTPSSNSFVIVQRAQNTFNT